VKSSGRVYLLDFQTYDDKYFFWLQEKDAENDEELCKKVNNIINSDGTGDDNKIDVEPNPQPSSGSRPGGLLGNVPNISNINQGGHRSGQQLPARPEDLTRMLQEALAQSTQRVRKQTPPLSEIFNPPALDAVFADPDFHAPLTQHLPEGQQDQQGLRESIKSAQLQQAIDSLDEAVNSEEIGTVLVSLGLETSVLKDASDGTDALIKALEKWAKDNK